MNTPPPRGLDRQGLDASFVTDETLKSNLILEGRLFLSQQRPDDAADRFARAAEIEQRLSRACLQKGLQEKGWVHQFSAAGCWAQAGNFHEAICIGDQLLAQSNLPSRLRQRIDEFTQMLRQRRTQWAAGLVLAVSSAE